MAVRNNYDGDCEGKRVGADEGRKVSVLCLRLCAGGKWACLTRLLQYPVFKALHVVQFKGERLVLSFLFPHSGQWLAAEVFQDPLP